MIRFLFAIGNGLLTLASVLTLGRRLTYFGQRVKHYNKPQYTNTKKHETIRTSKRNN